MTTIAYRDGVLAADSLVTENNRRVGAATKIARVGPVLFGVAGCLNHMIAFRDWMVGGMDGEAPVIGKSDDDTSQAVVIFDGHILSYSNLGWDRMAADYYAIGSGAGPALGAMAAGASAEQAVRAAMALDVFSGGDVTVLSLEA